MIQVDTLCHRIPNFMEKCRRAGVTRVFIGLENINPDNLKAIKKPQNKITEYRKMLLAWKAQGIFTYAGYILGLPADTPESIRRDIEIIQRELPLDIVEWAILTPAAGLRGPHQDVEERRRHGRQSQQLRFRACRRRPSQDEPDRMAGDL